MLLNMYSTCLNAPVYQVEMLTLLYFALPWFVFELSQLSSRASSLECVKLRVQLPPAMELIKTVVSGLVLCCFVLMLGLCQSMSMYVAKHVLSPVYQVERLCFALLCLDLI